MTTSRSNPDPLQRPRLEELIEALTNRKTEAEERGWLGEPEGIEISLNPARDKLDGEAGFPRLTGLPITFSDRFPAAESY